MSDEQRESDDSFVADVVGSCNPDNNGAGSSDLEKTIQNMQDSSICGHPRHFHSFQQVNFSLFSSLRKCAGCQGRLQGIVLFGGSSSQQIVRCVACGAIAHRSCALSASACVWKETCPVNTGRINAPSAESITSSENDTGGMHVNHAQHEEEETIEFIDGKEGAEIRGAAFSIATSKSDSVDESEPPSQQMANKESPEPSTTKQKIPSRSSSASSDAEMVEPLHHTSHPFASVARALQENIIAHFQHGSQNEYSRLRMEDDGYVDANPTTTIESKKSIVEMAGDTLVAAKSLQGNLGTAAVVGGIAGGVAGLVLAGPAGAYAGSKLGQVAGALGVIAEGSVTVGVFVASVATASVTAKQIQEQIHERHVLAMGEAGTSRKVLLVRPNIQIDPIWEEITREARSTVPKQPPLAGLIPTPIDKASRERYRRDSDIIETPEDEMPREDKILLLVSRILNDKSSSPGHVYRKLIQAFRDRCENRSETNATDDDNTVSLRARRDDAHAVIKHVAATLLEWRPEFAASPALTELTAAAVEGLVFGQLYDMVWEEIVLETAERDAALLNKTNGFRQELDQMDLSDDSFSKSALDALHLLPQSHSAVDKLGNCVRFLELISEHFSSSVNIGADSLLKMACQHLLMYLCYDQDKPKRIHAQVRFLEEFTRDEQLLRGREGYALVTLQAALHFLDMSDNFEKDIFGPDDEAEEDLMIEEEEMIGEAILASLSDEPLVDREEDDSGVLLLKNKVNNTW